VLVHVNGLSADYMFSRYPDVSDSVLYEQYDEAPAKEKVRAAQSMFALLRDQYADLLQEDTNA